MTFHQVGNLFSNAQLLTHMVNSLKSVHSVQIYRVTIKKVYGRADNGRTVKRATEKHVSAAYCWQTHKE